MSGLKVFVVCVLLACVGAQLMSPPVIDDFVTSRFIVAEHDEPDVVVVCEGTCLFESRTMIVERTMGQLGASTNLDFTPAGQDPNREVGILGYSNDVGVTSVATLRYFGAPPANLAAGGRDSFIIAACSLDQSNPVFINIEVDGAGGNLALASGAVSSALNDVCDEPIENSLVLRIPFAANTLQLYSEIDEMRMILSTVDPAIDAQFRFVCTAPQLNGRTFSVPVPLDQPSFTFSSELMNPIDLLGVGTSGIVRNIMFVPEGEQQPGSTMTLQTVSVTASSSNPAAMVTVIDTPNNLVGLLAQTVGSLQSVFIDIMLPGDVVTITYEYNLVDDPNIPGVGTVADFTGHGTWLTDVEIVNDEITLLNDAEFFANTNADNFLQSIDRCTPPSDIIIQFIQPTDPPTTEPPTTAPPTTAPPTTDPPTAPPPTPNDHMCVVPVFDQDTGDCTCETFPCEPLADGSGGFRCMTDAWYCIPVWREGGWPENPSFYRASWMAVTDQVCECPVFT